MDGHGRPTVAQLGDAFEDDLRGALDPVPPVVSELEPGLQVDQRLTDADHRQLVVAAHLEDVQEVCVEAQLQLDLDRVAVAVLDADPLVHPLVDEAGPANAQALAGDAGSAARLTERRVHQLEGRDVGAVHAVVQQDRLAAVDAELVGREKASVRPVEAEAVFVARGHVAGQVRDHEDVVLLEDDPVFEHDQGL